MTALHFIRCMPVHNAYRAGFVFQLITWRACGADVDEYQNRGNANSFDLGGGLGVKVVGPDGCNLQIQIASDVSIAITPVLDGNGQDTKGFHLQDSSSGHDYGTAVCP